MEDHIAKARSGDGKAENRHSNADLQSAPIHRPRSWLLPVAVTGGVAAIGGAGFWWLLWASQAFDRASDAVTFVTGGSLTLAILLVAVVQACVYWSQRGVMRKQWDAMERSVGRTDRIIEKMGGQLKAMEDSLTETRKMVNQNERAVKAAEDSVEVAQNHMIHAQRAYVMFQSASVEFLSDTRLAVAFAIKNFGNTPALNFRPFTRVELRTTGPEINEEDVEWEGPGGIIPPHYPVETERNLTITLAERKQMGAGQPLRLHIWGMIKYDDIFGKEHLTKFSAVHNVGKGPRFGSCETGNEAT